jgi:hypothetical protein
MSTRMAGRGAIVATLALALQSAGAASESRGRLDEPVTFSVTRVTLAEAVARLGEAAGVPLEVRGRGIAPRPVQLFIREQPLRPVMDEIARFAAEPPGACRWSAATVDGAAGYRLSEDQTSRLARERLHRRLFLERTRRLEASLRLAVQAARLSPEEWEAVRKRREDLAYWRSLNRPALAILTGVPADGIAALFSGRCILLHYQELDDAGKDAIHQIIGGLENGRLTAPIPGREPVVFDWIRERDLPRSRITFRLAGAPDRPGIWAFIPILPGGGWGDRNLIQPPARIDETEKHPPWLLKVVEKRKQEQEQSREEARKRARKDPDLQQKISVRSPVEVPDEKDPKKKLDRYCDLTMCLEQVAEESGLSILGDFDHCWDDYYSWTDPIRPGSRMRRSLDSPGFRDLPVWEVMESLAETFRITWQKRGRFLLVRSPRAPYAQIDGIDMLEMRPGPLPKELQDLLRDSPQ